MNLGMVMPNDSRFDMVPAYIEKVFPDIHPVFFYYDDYKDVVKLLQNQQKNLDGILFSGSTPYNYAKYYLKQETTWDYINRYSGSLFRCVLQAYIKGYDITKLSYDYFGEDELSSLLTDFNIHVNPGNILSYDDVCKAKSYIEHYNEIVYDFHKKNLMEGRAVCAVTPCLAAYQLLIKNGMPAILSYPTIQDCRDVIERIRANYMSKTNQKSQIVILSVEINLPNEYSMFAKNERMFMQDRNGISSCIYTLAERMEATVVEPTYRNFLIFTTRDIIESMTHNFSYFDALDQVGDHFLSSICIGIGYGNTVRKAKENANTGLIQAKRYGLNSAFVVFENEAVYGPLKGKDTTEDKSPEMKVNQKIEEISSRTEVSMQNIFKLYDIIIKSKKNTFTIKELAGFMSISPRSVNRIVNKLEISGDVEIIGKQAAYQIGRPSRVVRINFNL